MRLSQSVTCFGFVDVFEQPRLQRFEFGRQAGVVGRVGSAADRVGAADRGGGLAHRFQRRRVVGVGLADRHRLQLRQRRLQLFFGDLRRADQPRQRLVGVFVRAPSATLRERRSALMRRLGPPRSRTPNFSCSAAERGLLLRFGELLGALGEAVERVDRPLAAGGRPAEAVGDQLRALRRPGRSPRASRPAPSLASEMPPRSCATPPAATPRLRPSRPSCLTGPMFAVGGEQRVAEFLQRLDPLARPAPGRSPPARRAASAIRCWKRSSAARLLGVGDRRLRRWRRRPGTALRSRARSRRRSVPRPGGPGRPVGSCSGLGGPVFSADRRRRQDAARRRRSATAAGAGRRSAAPTSVISRERSPFGARADPPAVDVGAEQGQQRRADEGGDGDAEDRRPSPASRPARRAASRAG